MIFRSLYSRLGIYLLLGVFGLVIFYPVLFAHQIFADSDVILQQYTSLSFLRGALRGGGSIAWNPHVLTGFIPIVGLMGGLLSWLNQLLYKLFSVYTAFSWLTFFNFFLTSIFTYELVRALGLRKTSALFAALVLPWTNAHFIWAANMTVSAGHILLPALFLLILFLSRSRSFWKSILIVIFGGGLVGTLMLTAHFQWSLQAIFAVGFWALFLDFQHWRKKDFPLFHFQTLVFAFLILFVALAVFWPQLSASLMAKTFSARSSGVSFTDAQTGALLPGDILSLFFPNLSLPKGVSQPGLFYIGGASVLLLIFSWWGPKSQYYKFFAATAILAILASIKFSPLLWLLHHLPLFSSFRDLSRLVYVGIFGLVILSAYGLEYLLGIIPDELFRKRSRNAMWLGLIVLTGFCLWSLIFPKVSSLARTKAASYIESRFSRGTLTLPKDHYYQVVDRSIQDIGRQTTLPHLPVTAAMVSLALAGLILYFRPRLNQQRFAFYMIAVASLNLLLINSASLSFVSAFQLENPPPPLAYLQKVKGDFRIITLFSGFTIFDKLDTPYDYNSVDNVDFLKNLLTPNLGTLYGVDTLDYYDNLLDRRHSRLLAYLGSDRSLETSDILVDQKIRFSDKVNLFLQRLPLLSRYNVRYIISAYQLRHPDLKKVFQWQATSHDIPLYLYENLRVQPRYYLTAAAEILPPLSEEDSWLKNLDATKQNLVLLECERCQPVKAVSSSLQLIFQTNSQFQFVTDANSDQYLVFGQNFLPGWRAYVDGREAEIYRANFVNQAIFVPAGRHQVKFNFSLEDQKLPVAAIFK